MFPDTTFLDDYDQSLTRNVFHLNAVSTQISPVLVPGLE